MSMDPKDPNTKPTAVVYDPAAYNAWVDQQLQPGDKGDPARALIRRVKQHEFVMSGGLVEKVEGGITTYGPPVDPAKTPVCPWHGEGCSAWKEIVEGRGTGTFDGPTLRELREMTPEEIAENRRADDIERIAHNHNTSRKEATRVVDSMDKFEQERQARWDRLNKPKEPSVAAQATTDLSALAEDMGDEITFDGDEDDEPVSGNINEQEGK